MSAPHTKVLSHIHPSDNKHFQNCLKTPGNPISPYLNPFVVLQVLFYYILTRFQIDLFHDIPGLCYEVHLHNPDVLFLVLFL